EIQLKELAGKPHLVAMLYTRCQTACPMIVNEILLVQKDMPKKTEPLSVVVFSFDSKYESPATMTEFIKKRKLGSNWRILKSDKSAVTEIAAVLGVRYK